MHSTRNCTPNNVLDLETELWEYNIKKVLYLSSIDKECVSQMFKT